MRSKNFIFYAGGLLVLGLLVFLLSTNGTRSYTWSEHYKEQNKGPFGLKVVFKLLKSRVPTSDFILLKKRLNKSLSTQPGRKSNYVFMGSGQYLDSADAETLLRFVANGNDAFIATRVLPFNLMFKLYVKPCGDAKWTNLNYYQDKTVRANFEHPSLRNATGFGFEYRHLEEDKLYDWHFFDTTYFCDNPRGLVALGKLNGNKINFVRIRHGRGNFYLHSNPLFFTNLFMIEKTGKDYAERAFAHLSNGPIYWDCTSKVPRDVAENLNAEGQGGRRRRDFSRPSPLSYVLSQPPLAWAWYVLLGATLVYFLFRVKRRQRIIPILPANKNNSLAFIRTIGRLYFLQNSHRQLALQSMKLFLQFVRDRYQLQTRDLQEEFVHQLRVKSEVKLETIKYILDMHNLIERSPEITDKALVDFHQKIEYFYKTCK